MEMMENDKAEADEYKAKSDVRTLVEAEEIRSDKPRFKRAVAMAKKQRAELDKVQA